MPGGFHAPTEEILKWPAPNYAHPTTRPNTLTWMACILGPFTLAMLMARLWVRIYHQRNPGWDDWLAIAGTVPTLAVTCLIPLSLNSGFGRHIWDINVLEHPEQVINARKYVLAILCVFCVASGTIKTSILLFYRRLSSRVVSNSFRWACWITIAFIASSATVQTILPIFGCYPISAFWNQMDPRLMLTDYKYHCFDEGANMFSACVISTVQDLMAAILPTFLYWNLRIPVRQKVVLFGVFAIGYGAAALGAMRAYYSWHIYFLTYDVTWVSWDLFVVSMLELHVGCFCANAPSLKVFFKHFFHEKLSSSAKRSAVSGQDDHMSGRHPSNSSASVLKAKVIDLFSKGNSAHSRGYLSEPHADITVDAHGGVQVQKEVHVIVQPTQHSLRDPTDTTDLVCGQYYDDVELGHFATSQHLTDADIEARPVVAQSLNSPSSMRSSVSLFPQTKSPQTSTH